MSTTNFVDKIKINTESGVHDADIQVSAQNVRANGQMNLADKLSLNNSLVFPETWTLANILANLNGQIQKNSDAISSISNIKAIKGKDGVAGQDGNTIILAYSLVSNPQSMEDIKQSFVDLNLNDNSLSNYYIGIAIKPIGTKWAQVDVNEYSWALLGRPGPQGPVKFIDAFRILGTVEKVEDIPSTGAEKYFGGDAYFVNNEETEDGLPRNLYVYQEDGQWLNQGNIKGTDGKSAYDLYKETIEDGKTPLSQDEWLNNLKGKDGKDGKDGESGKNGSPFLGTSVSFTKKILNSTDQDGWNQFIITQTSYVIDPNDSSKSIPGASTIETFEVPPPDALFKNLKDIGNASIISNFNSLTDNENAIPEKATLTFSSIFGSGNKIEDNSAGGKFDFLENKYIIIQGDTNTINHEATNILNNIRIFGNENTLTDSNNIRIFGNENTLTNSNNIYIFGGNNNVLKDFSNIYIFGNNNTINEKLFFGIGNNNNFSFAIYEDELEDGFKTVFGATNNILLNNTIISYDSNTEPRLENKEKTFSIANAFKLSYENESNVSMQFYPLFEDELKKRILSNQPVEQIKVTQAIGIEGNQKGQVRSRNLILTPYNYIYGYPSGVIKNIPIRKKPVKTVEILKKGQIGILFLVGAREVYEKDKSNNDKVTYHGDGFSSIRMPSKFFKNLNITEDTIKSIVEKGENSKDADEYIKQIQQNINKLEGYSYSSLCFRYCPDPAIAYYNPSALFPVVDITLQDISNYSTDKDIAYMIYYWRNDSLDDIFYSASYPKLEKYMNEILYQASQQKDIYAGSDYIGNNNFHDWPNQVTEI